MIGGREYGDKGGGGGGGGRRGGGELKQLDKHE